MLIDPDTPPTQILPSDRVARVSDLSQTDTDSSGLSPSTPTVTNSGSARGDSGYLGISAANRPT